MTARLPSEPVRVTNWLAGWVDYMFAIVLVAGRWLRAPLSRRESEPVMLSAFAPAMSDSFAPRWHDSPADPTKSETSGLVKAAEIVMLSLSFFLAAHLLSGGTPTVTAPDLNPLGLLPDHARAETLPVPAAGGKEVEVLAHTFVVDSALTPTLEVNVPAEIAVLAPPSQPEVDAAAAPDPAPAPAPDPTPAPTAEEAAVVEPPAPPPSPVAAATQAPETLDPGRYLATDELRAAALAAGWSAELLSEIEYVAWCESRFHTHAEYLGAQGLMQMMPFWFDYAGLDPDKWWDPVTNLTAARFAYDEQIRNGGEGWGPWTCRPIVE